MNVADYPRVRWPWIGFLLGLTLLLYDRAVRLVGNVSSLTVSSYYVAITTIAVTCLCLLVMPRRRAAYLLGFVVCAGLMGYAFYLQYVELLEPCPLCMFQRVCVVALGILFLIAALHNPNRVGAAVYALLILLVAGTGAALAARHIWIQSLPPDQVPACGMGINYMLQSMPFTDVVTRVLQGSGECAEKGWEFLHLTIPGWTFVFFVASIISAIALVQRDN